MNDKILIKELSENEKLKKEIKEDLNKNKTKFIEEIKKNGDEIKSNPLKVEIKKENFFIRIIKKFFNLF